MRLLPNTNNTYLVTENQTNFIIKQLPINQTSASEVLILSSISHPYITPLISFTSENGFYKLKFPFYRKSDLAKQISVRTSPFTEATVIKFLFQSLSALAYLHKNQITHRDIKPANILISPTQDFHLTDFGVSNQQNLMQTCVGTPIFISPEIINNEKYDCLADIWSLGVTTITMMQLSNPFKRKSMIDTLNAITGRKMLLNDRFDEFSEQLKIFVQGMITDRESRPNSQKLLQSTLFQGFLVNQKQNNLETDELETTQEINLKFIAKIKKKASNTLFQEVQRSENELKRIYLKRVMNAEKQQKIKNIYLGIEFQAWAKLQLMD